MMPNIASYFALCAVLTATATSRALNAYIPSDPTASLRGQSRELRYLIDDTTAPQVGGGTSPTFAPIAESELIPETTFVGAPSSSRPTEGIGEESTTSAEITSTTRGTSSASESTGAALTTMSGVTRDMTTKSPSKDEIQSTIAATEPLTNSGNISPTVDQGMDQESNIVTSPANSSPTSSPLLSSSPSTSGASPILPNYSLSLKHDNSSTLPSVGGNLSQVNSTTVQTIPSGNSADQSFEKWAADNSHENNAFSTAIPHGNNSDSYADYDDDGYTYDDMESGGDGYTNSLNNVSTMPPGGENNDDWDDGDGSSTSWSEVSHTKPPEGDDNDDWDSGVQDSTSWTEISSTNLPTQRPTYEYKPNQDDLIANGDASIGDDHKSVQDKVSTYLNDLESAKEMEDDKNVQIVARSLTAVFLVLLFLTAHQTMENPDGLCARYMCCNRSEQSLGRRSHAPMRAPFPSDLELS